MNIINFNLILKNIIYNMKFLKKYEEFTPVEYVPSERPHKSYKNEVKKRKRKKLGEIEPIKVLPNKVKDILLFKPKY